MPRTERRERPGRAAASEEGAISLYGISDLHLFADGGVGRRPNGLVHSSVPPRLIERWQRQVEPGSWVLVPGDISDSSPQLGLQADYRLLDQLPGRKLISPGNHDQGPWRRQAKLERFCRQFPSLVPLASGRAVRLVASAEAPGLVVAAAMGACAPADAWFGGEINLLGPSNPRHRFNDELTRLAQALAEAESIAEPGDRLIVGIHYPPFVNFSKSGPFSERIEAAGADLCIYGHLHQESESGFEGQRNGVRYRVVAAPRLAMRPLRLGELTASGVRWALDEEGS